MQAIIVGTGGIGGALARLLHAEQWQLTLVGRQQKSLDPVAAACPGAATRLCDAGDWTAMDALAQNLRNTVTDGHLAIVNTVGSILLKPAHRTTQADWQTTLQVNLGSAFHTVRLAAAIGKPASVLLFSTVAARIGLANHEAIAAAKAGIEGLVRSAAATYANRNIRFNAIAPGLVDTALASPITSRPAARTASENLHPLGRIGDPDQVARVAATLIAADNDWITGAVWSVDGGLARCRP